jgi:hypothetical protein
MYICEQCETSTDNPRYYYHKLQLCRKCYRKQSHIKEAERASYDRWKQNNIEYVRSKQTEWRSNNAQYIQNYRKEHLDDINDNTKRWQNNNRDRVRRNNKIWYKNNKDKVYKRVRERTDNDPVFKLSRNIRSLILRSFKEAGYDKTSRTYEILCCDYITLYRHLLCTFIERYNRLPSLTDNVHIDHVVPLATAHTENEVIRLNHYTNLQWLLAEDNLKKGSKL